MTIPGSVRQRVEEAANYQCGYCRMPTQFVYAPMQIDHIVPSSKGGTDAENNLWLACPRCNNFKGDQAEAIDPDTGDRVGLFNPRLQH